MRALVKALLLGLVGLAICSLFPSMRVALAVTAGTAVIASWRAIKRRFR
jgi:hypothetical protein